MSHEDYDRKKSKQQRWADRQDRSKNTRDEIVELRASVEVLKGELDNGAGDRPTAQHFDELPISSRTVTGLHRGNYKKMTPIQCDALPLALTGHDVLGAAKTGSGKTLSYIIPLLEKLYLEKWDPEAGIGALVLAPTRELALQIFKVLQLVGFKHVFSAALLTGGRDVNEEKKRLHLISIVVGTPGRVLHHLRDTTGVTIENLQIFIMDEADRLLDMGFREALTEILTHLPSQRQTLLFSATQTTDVKMLAQMSLNEPKYISADMSILTAPTPNRMCQNFIVLELHRKLDALMMFIKRHPSDKIIVFISTCNQVKYMYLAFSRILKKMRIPSMCLTGKMKQFRREEVFLTFCRCKSAVLFSTDIAARGLDFPMVHWVVHYDCPDSAQTYIHRAGRTARGGARGVSLLFLTPSETPMLSFLDHKKIPLREILIKSHLMNESKEIFVAMVVQGLKYDAQKAFIAYLRSIFFAANKHVFKLESIDCAKFAASLGLLVVPNMSELQNLHRVAKNLPYDVVNFISNKEKSDQKTLTRKEKHLAASDMFRMMETKQRFVNKDDAEASDSEDVILVKKKVCAAPGHAELPSSEKLDVATDLSFDDRMAGISRNKKKFIIETADLRTKDLGLSKRTVFDAAGNSDDENSAVTKRLMAGVAGSTADDDDDGAHHPQKYREKLRTMLEHSNQEDAARSKQHRKDIRLKRAGKLDKKDGKRQRGDDEGVQLERENEYDSGSDNDDDLNELLQAARGERVDTDEDEEEEGNVDFTEDGGNIDYTEEAEEEEAEAAPAPVRKRSRKENSSR